MSLSLRKHRVLKYLIQHNRVQLKCKLFTHQEIKDRFQRKTTQVFKGRMWIMERSEQGTAGKQKTRNKSHHQQSLQQETLETKQLTGKKWEQFPRFWKNKRSQYNSKYMLGGRKNVGYNEVENVCMFLVRCMCICVYGQLSV